MVRGRSPARGGLSPWTRGPSEEGTYLASGCCDASDRALGVVVISLTALLLRRLGDPSAERRGAGLEFWGSNSSSGMTSSQRAPRKPERHTQSWGRLQDPLFWQGGWHTAAETGRGMRAGAGGRGGVGGWGGRDSFPSGGPPAVCSLASPTPAGSPTQKAPWAHLPRWGYPVISEQPIRD